MGAYFTAFELTGEPRIHRCERAWRWDVAAMPDYDIWCVLNGHGAIRIDGQVHSIRPGSCWLLEPGVSCQASHDPDRRLRVFSVHLAPANGDSGLRRPGADERTLLGAEVTDLGLLEALVRGCIQAFHSEGPVALTQTHLYIRQILLMLLQDATRSPSQAGDHRVAAVHQAIVEDPGRPWSVADMARQAGLSRSRFTRLFNQATGRSPIACVLEARARRARQLLRESALQVQEIADLLGYNDIFYFSRQFKQLVGQSPSEYRRSQQARPQRDGATPAGD